MIESITCVYRLILPEFRNRFYGLVAISTLVALLEMIGVASILPLVAVMAEPAALTNNKALQSLVKLFFWAGTIPPVHVVGFITIGLFLLANLASLAMSWWSIRYSARLSVALSRKLAEAHFRQPFQYFMTNQPAVLANQLCNEVAQFSSNGILQLCGAIVRTIQIALIAVFLTWLAPLFTLGSLAVLAFLYTLVYRASSKRLVRSGQIYAETAGEALHLATEMYGNARDILLRGGSATFAKRVCDKLTVMFEADRVGRLLPSIPKYALEIIAVCLVFALPIYRSLMGQDARAEMPLIATFAYAGFRLLPTMQQLYSSLAILKSYQPSAGRLLAVLGTANATQAGAERLDRMPLSITFDGVSHTYKDASREALARADFTLKRGSRVAVIGPSGAGKSTLVDILLGFLDPTGGRILIDDRPISADRLAWRSGAVGYVPQAPLILTDTLAANIAFGQELAALDEMRCREAAAQAGIAHLIERQPKGLHAIVGSDVQNFSGGELQRLAIARALYSRPSLLVLDEPTSALDPLAASRLFAMLRGKDFDGTVIVITHDIEHLAGLDAVIFMEGGQVVMAGPLETLEQNCPEFVRFQGAGAEA